MTLHALPTTRVRVDRIVAPYWRAMEHADREAIEASIPDGHVLTVLARTGVFDWTARLIRETGPHSSVLVRAARGRHLALVMRAALEGIE